MTPEGIYKRFTTELNRIYPPGETAAILKILMQHYAGGDSITAIPGRRRTIDENTEKLLEATLEKLMRHEPLQYVIGEAWFYGLKFFVNEHVLIPRPETEELVDEVIKYLKSDPAKTLIDIGSGSGCIPVSIKKNIPAAGIISVDVSKNALQVAQKNADENKVSIEFLQVDFLNEQQHDLLPQADIIISNPPYIPADEKNSMDKNVTMHEPALALFVPQDDPLIFYKKIKSFADGHLSPEGRIFLEVHENLAKETAAVFDEESYTTVIKKDMSGKERMLIISHSRSQ